MLTFWGGKTFDSYLSVISTLDSSLFAWSVVIAKGKGSHMTWNFKNTYAVAKCLRQRAVSVIWSNNLSVCIFRSSGLEGMVLYVHIRKPNKLGIIILMTVMMITWLTIILDVSGQHDRYAHLSKYRSNAALASASFRRSHLADSCHLSVNDIKYCIVSAMTEVVIHTSICSCFNYQLYIGN